jgi:hypothetical protein
MISMKDLPWVDGFLRPIREEYKKAPPRHELVEPSHADISYIRTLCADTDPFDTLGLKNDCYEALLSGKADILKSECELGSILLVELVEHPVRPTWNTWWRAIRILTGTAKKPVRIVIFGHPRLREMPKKMGEPITAEHLNGGMAERCNAGTIVIYRQEEVTRVLIHELFHASCSDPYYNPTPLIEADTEAWAEMVLCGMAAKGALQPWIRYMREQIDYALKQASTARNNHGVYSPKDYAWRYLVGRLDVWRRLGIQVPWFPANYKKITSLRFSVCEPKDD